LVGVLNPSINPPGLSFAELTDNGPAGSGADTFGFWPDTVRIPSDCSLPYEDVFNAAEQPLASGDVTINDNDPEEPQPTLRR
jgi:hypothetical protein